MKKLIILFSILLLTGCGGDFNVPPPASSPVDIQIEGSNGVSSSMHLNAETVKTVVATNVASGEAALRLDLTDKGAKALYAITSVNIGQHLQVYWEGDVVSDRIIDSPLGGSRMAFVIVLPNSTPSEIQSMISSISSGSKSLTN